MHFSLDVVEQAPSCPLLLYACLAIAARHLSHTKHLIPPNTADEYHERCIAILLPTLENRDFSIGIEVLLASTVILRFFEQISCACDGKHELGNDWVTDEFRVHLQLMLHQTIFSGIFSRARSMLAPKLTVQYPGVLPRPPSGSLSCRIYCLHWCTGIRSG